MVLGNNTVVLLLSTSENDSNNENDDKNNGDDDDDDDDDDVKWFIGWYSAKPQCYLGIYIKYKAHKGIQVRYLMRGINGEKLGLKCLNVGKILTI